MTEMKIQKLPAAKLAKLQSVGKRQRYKFAGLTEEGLFFEVEDTGEVNAKGISRKLLSVRNAASEWLRRNQKPWQLNTSSVTVKGKPMIRCVRIK